MGLDRTPEEQRVLDEIAAQTAAGGDPFGDDEELVRPGAGGEPPAADGAADAGKQASAEADDGNEGEDGEGQGTQKAEGEDGHQAAATDEQQQGDDGKKAGTPADDQRSQDLDPDVLADIADPLQLRQPTRFQAEVPKDFKEQRSKLLGEKAAATARLMNGEIDTDAYAAEEVRIAEALDELTRQQVRAETLADVNRQNEASYSQLALDSLIRRAKVAGEIDYKATPGAAQHFDRALQVVLADPEFASKDIAEAYAEAHSMVCARLGVQRKTAAGAGGGQQDGAAGKTEVPNRQPAGAAPLTLRNLPAAASTTPAGGVEEQMARLHGPEYEAAFSKLTPAQKARLLDEE